MFFESNDNPFLIAEIGGSHGGDPERLKNARWEFVGKKASNKVRELYVGKILERKRSYGDPFVLVGYDESSDT